MNELYVYTYIDTIYIYTYIICMYIYVYIRGTWGYFLLGRPELLPFLRSLRLDAWHSSGSGV